MCRSQGILGVTYRPDFPVKKEKERKDFRALTGFSGGFNFVINVFLVLSFVFFCFIFYIASFISLLLA